jgi:hypothetical protein
VVAARAAACQQMFRQRVVVLQQQTNPGQGDVKSIKKISNNPELWIRID